MLALFTATNALFWFVLIVKIPYNKKVLETQNVPQNVPRKTDEQKIIEMIKNNPKTTRKEMAEAIEHTADYNSGLSS